jgi:ANTAR domain-containing protein
MSVEEWPASLRAFHANRDRTFMSLARVTAAIASAARRLNQSDASVEATLEAIALAARDSIPGFDLAGISTVDADGNVTTRAASDPLVLKFDEVQYSLGEGPCLDALGAAHVVSVPRIRHEQRWPRYVPEVVRLGLRSQLAVKLDLDGNGTLSGINLYSTISDDIEPEAESIAELFAIHAATTLGSVIQIDQLNQAMHTRKVIGQAVGILMERYDIPEDNAFTFLIRASQSDNIKVRDIAQELVDKINGPKHAR